MPMTLMKSNCLLVSKNFRVRGEKDRYDTGPEPPNDGVRNPATHGTMTGAPIP